MATLTRRKFTTAEYHEMARTGILGEDDRVELIEGEIVEMTPIGSLRASVVKRLLKLLLPLESADKVILSVQDPIHLSAHSEPQPDLAVLRPRPDFYASGHPEADDVFLVVEVADTSAEYDRETKLPLYGRHGVEEAWLIDLSAGRVEVHRSPRPEGFTSIQLRLSGDQVSPQAFPGFSLDVDAILASAISQ